MNALFKNKTCWVVTEGIAGTENQCLGVAEALGFDPSVKRITLREPWKSLSPFLGFEQWWTFKPLIFPPWPDVLIAGGRKSIAVSRYIKKKSGGQTFTVQLQDPRVKAEHFDLIAVPAHDALRGENVLVTAASPNRITKPRLAREKLKFKEALDRLPEPRAAVLIGGNSKTHSMNDAVIDTLIKNLKAINAGLMITISRRTPEKYAAKLRAALDGNNIYFWDGQGDNPYFAFLAYADFIICTNDSASMISEAATTGKPLYVVPLEGESEKFKSFYNNLKKHGALREFNGTLETWSYEPLNDAQKVAEAIKIAYERKFKADKTG